MAKKLMVAKWLLGARCSGQQLPRAGLRVARAKRVLPLAVPQRWSPDRTITRPTATLTTATPTGIQTATPTGIQIAIQTARMSSMPVPAMQARSRWSNRSR